MWLKLDPPAPALTPLDARHLLRLTVKLLDLPANGTRRSCVARRRLSQLVGYDVVRALGGERQPEQLHPVPLRELAQVHGLAPDLLPVAPRQGVYALVGPPRFAYLPVRLDRAVVELAGALDLLHQGHRGVPGVHQDRPERQGLLMHHVLEHLSDVIELRLPVLIGGVDPVVDDPEPVGLGVDVDAVDHADAADDALGVPAPLPPRRLDLARVVLVEHGVIEEEVPLLGGHELAGDLLPDQARGDLLALEVAVYGVVAPALGVVGEVGDGVVDRAGEEERAVVEPGEALGAVAHRVVAVRCCGGARTYSSAPSFA